MAVFNDHFDISALTLNNNTDHTDIVNSLTEYHNKTSFN